VNKRGEFVGFDSAISLNEIKQVWVDGKDLVSCVPVSEYEAYKRMNSFQEIKRKRNEF